MNISIKIILLVVSGLLFSCADDNTETTPAPMSKEEAPAPVMDASETAVDQSTDMMDQAKEAASTVVAEMKEEAIDAAKEKASEMIDENKDDLEEKAKEKAEELGEKLMDKLGE